MAESAGCQGLIALQKAQFRLSNSGAKGETGDLMSRNLKLITILACATLALSACGKRGALEPPPEENGESAPRVKHSGGTKKDKEGYVHSRSSAENGHRPFVLDGLLR
jgi:predicted small lipoprotein YifL